MSDSARRPPLPWRLRIACFCYAWAALATLYLLIGLPLGDGMTGRDAWNAFVLGAFVVASIVTLAGIVRRRRFVRTSILLGVLAAFQIVAAMETVAAAVRGSAAASPAAVLPFLLAGSGWVAMIVGMVCCLPVWTSGREG